MGSNQELATLIQRGISTRTKEITEYLTSSEHRFLGGIVIAAWGGEPQYTPMSIDDPDGMLSGLDREFGVLTFDGTQAYFVLDGQHRVRAIKDAIKKDPNLAKEDICALIVTHYDTDDGRTRTRRLFSNINRNAKATGKAENIALDEDDGYAIVTRMLLEEHPFLKRDGVVRVITYAGPEGELKLAPANIGKTDAKALTSFTVLYGMVEDLGFDFPGAMADRTTRPTDAILDECYRVVSKRLDDLLTQCGNVGTKLENAGSARDIRAPKEAEDQGHAFMRPVVQRAVCKTVALAIQQQDATWQELMERLSELDWTISEAPWSTVFDRESKKMLSGKDFSNLLPHVLRMHLAPPSVQSIKRTRREYKHLRGHQYPVTEDDLAGRVVKHEEAKQ